MRGIAMWLVIAACSWAYGYPRALADEEHADEIAAGRAAFVAATHAAAEQRWADALTGFERAYELTAAPPALLNVGVVLRALGRQREARDAFDRLLVEHPEFAAQTDAVNLRTEVAARVAALILTGLEATPHQLRLDGRSLGTRQGPRLELELDPGEHGVLLERDGYRPWQWEGILGDGERREIHVELTPVPLLPQTPSRLGRRLAIVLTTIAVIAGVGLAVALQRGAQLRPTYANTLEL